MAEKVERSIYSTCIFIVEPVGLTDRLYAKGKLKEK